MDVLVNFDVAIPMRDGVVLRANIARPVGEGRWPVIVIRTPYGKDSPKPDPLMDLSGIAREGFAVVLQDVRHRYASGGEGEFTPFIHEGEDGEDLIAWAAKQPFSNGDVFAVGSSYGGFAQWAAAVKKPDALRAIAPHQSPSLPWRTLLYRGGVFELGAMAALFLSFAPDTLMRRYASDPSVLGPAIGQLMKDIDGLTAGGFDSLPLETFEPLARSGVGEALFEMLSAGNDTTCPSLQALVEAQAYERITVPALISGGWYDFFLQGAIDQFVGMRSRAGSASARERTRLVLGPWTHAAQAVISGERHFGIGSSWNGRGETLRFFREQITGDAPSGAPVKIFVMGANAWRDEQEWPLARTQTVPWYLGSGGNANSLHGDGTLNQEQAASSLPDRFIYDPANPVPTWGGGNLGFTELAGPRDQRRIESRHDVLVYTSDILYEALEVTGTVVVELWIVSSAPDTDFVARLVDVTPDGTAYNLAEGILRSRYRQNPEALGSGIPLEPATPTLLRIELTPNSNLFLAGHRIRLDVTSSSFPRWARNLNIWESHGATLAEAKIAEQTVLHEEAYPSRVLLPVIAN